jgi:hypothetical protein
LSTWLSFGRLAGALLCSDGLPPEPRFPPEPGVAVRDFAVVEGVPVDGVLDSSVAAPACALWVVALLEEPPHATSAIVVRRSSTIAVASLLVLMSFCASKTVS